LRDISAKELALYTQFHRLPHRAVPILSTGIFMAGIMGVKLFACVLF